MNNNCSSSSSGAESSAPGGGSGTSLTQSTPFNFSKFGILAVFCIILALSSSTYHNWPAIERSLVTDKVFQNLCTENEIREAVPEMYVCEKQRDAIGNLSLNIFLFEFIAYSIGGPLVDVVGVYIVMIAGFIFGFSGFLLLYFRSSSVFAVKLSFCFWGMFGGLIIITSIHFARLFPEAKSLADGMMIFFENFASVIPLIIYKLIKRFGITYYEGYGGYIIWGIVPSFLLALSYIPIKIIPEKYPKSENNFFEFDFKCLTPKLGCWQLWANLVVFSIPVTSAMFYRKTFSAYFLKNPQLQKVFPFILLFVFLPIPFISALDQFMSVHLTSAFLYIVYILAFVCFFYKTETHGLISMVLFCIAHSAEHQIMHYISKSHKQFESTLMGLSYSVVFVVGFISQYIFDCIYRFSPKAALYTIISLLLVATIFSVSFDIIERKTHSEPCYNKKNDKSSANFLSSLRVVYVIFWFIPFVFLLIRMLFSSKEEEAETKWKYCICKMAHYADQKFVTTTMVFYSFSFYYVCSVFTVIATIFKVCKSTAFEFHEYRFIFLLVFLTSFFIVPHVITAFHFSFNNQTYLSIFKLLIVLFICKVFLFMQSMNKFGKTSAFLFSGFLVIYGYTFFLFIHMLAYYNFQITYVERSHKCSLIHWGGMFTLFLLLTGFYVNISKYPFGYYTLWAFSTGYFAFFSIQLIYYFSYEMDLLLRFGACNLPVPRFQKFSKLKEIKPESFCTSLFSIALLISNLAILISFEFCLNFIVVFFWCGLNDLATSAVSIVPSHYFKKDNFDTINHFILPISSLSFALFVALFLCHAIMFDSNFNNKGFIYVLIICSFVVLSYYSNISWYNTQYELQNCCCRKDSGSCGCIQDNKCCCCCREKCTCCLCLKCCCCKQATNQCDCCTKSSEKCCCTDETCECCKGTCDCCTQKSGCKCCEKCDKCVCICLKKSYLKSKIIVLSKFIECTFTDVDSNFFSFYLGNNIGWLLFILYFALSKDKNVYNSFK